VSWTRYLRGTCVFAMDVAPDGTVWVQAARMDSEAELETEPVLRPLEPIQTYAIRPHAGTRG